MTRIGVPLAEYFAALLRRVAKHLCQPRRVRVEEAVLLRQAPPATEWLLLVDQGSG